MRTWSNFLILATAALFFGCGESKVATPLETFKTYTKAIKAKDTTTMKLLLSDATLKMHEKEAKAQGVTVDEIVKRETLFSETQNVVEYRNEKIEGDKATLQVKTSFGSWETVPFVREEGVWKIDKQGYADQMLKEMDEQNRKMDEIINGGQMQPTPYVQPTPFTQPIQPTPFAVPTTSPMMQATPVIPPNQANGAS